MDTTSKRAPEVSAEAEQTGRVVEVGDFVEPPVHQLCWKQSDLMARCDRAKGHKGRHTWESAEADRNARLLKMAHEDLTCRNGYRHYCPNCDNSIGEHLLTEMDAALASSRSGEAPAEKAPDGTS